MRKLLSTTLAALTLSLGVAGAVRAQPYSPIPPLRAERRPLPPHPGYVWRPGYWNWAGGRYAWVGGIYIAPTGGGYYGGSHWVRGHWGARGAWVPAHWAR